MELYGINLLEARSALRQDAGNQSDADTAVLHQLWTRGGFLDSFWPARTAIAFCGVKIRHNLVAK